MMYVDLERELACSPATAFGLVSVPELMNHWSTAPVKLESPGDGGHPAGIGALRSVRPPGPARMTLRVVVVDTTPPERFSYRVYAGAPIRNHRGDITITPTESGCRLRWQVNIELPVKALKLLLERTLLPELERSLDAMVAYAPRAAALDLPKTRTVDDDDELPALYERAEMIRDEQRQRADAMTRTEPRYWFTRVYQHVSTLQITACRAGHYHHRAWVLRLIEHFHQLYVRNLDRDRDDSSTVESHWARAFSRMDRTRAWGRSRFDTMGYCVFHGMKAHIEDDLPRALADVYASAYAKRCDYVRFRADYLAMESIFRDAGDALVAELEPHEIPLRTRLLTRVLPLEARNAYMAKKMYDIPRERTKAFDRGARIAALLAAR